MNSCASSIDWFSSSCGTGAWFIGAGVLSIDAGDGLRTFLFGDEDFCLSWNLWCLISSERFRIVCLSMVDESCWVGFQSRMSTKWSTGDGACSFGGLLSTSDTYISFGRLFGCYGEVFFVSGEDAVV